MDATRQGDFQKAAILFKAINRNKPFNGSAMNSPPTPPYYGSVAAALHLMNSQIRCGSCRKKVYGVCSINYGIRNVQKKVLTFWLAS